MEVNGDFAHQVGQRLAQKGLSKHDPVILLCRSGDRSARAADLLADLGYTRVYSLTEGFEGDQDATGRRSVNGWKNAGMPWSYRLDPAKVIH